MDKENLIEQYLEEIRKHANSMSAEEITKELARLKSISHDTSKEIETDDHRLETSLKSKKLIDRVILRQYMQIKDTESLFKIIGCTYDNVYNEQLSISRRLEPNKTSLSEQESKRIKEDIESQQNNITKGFSEEPQDSYIRLYTNLLFDEIKSGELGHIIHYWMPSYENLLGSLGTEEVRNEFGDVRHGEISFPWELIRILVSTMPGVDSKKILSATNFKDVVDFLPKEQEEMYKLLHSLLKNYVNSLNPQTVFNSEHELEQQEETRRGRHFK